MIITWEESSTKLIQRRKILQSDNRISVITFIIHLASAQEQAANSFGFKSRNYISSDARS